MVLRGSGGTGEKGEREMKLMKKFKTLKTDKERWELLITNKESGLVVMLDNDDTFIVDNNDADADPITFDWYIGKAPGIPELLEAIGIESEGV